ncbi:MAG: hypothetical protein PHO89_05255 [Methylacidiphilaceae bacterium]|nr:hypothetical protein [Candidatus Methylacidiphilaceae bacterium]
MTANSGLKVYQNVYTGQPGSSYVNPSYQTLKQGVFVTSAGQTRKDTAGNTFDLVHLPGTQATGWIEAQTKGGVNLLRDLPTGEQQGYATAQSLLTAEDPHATIRSQVSNFQRQALSDLQSQAGNAPYLKGFVEGLGPSGMSTLLAVTAQTYDPTKETVSGAAPAGRGNPYETIANALRKSGINLDPWSHQVVSRAKGSLGSPLAVQGTRALFNQLVLDQAYGIRNGKTNLASVYSERCASFSYNALRNAGIRADVLNTINGGPNGLNDAQNQCAAAQSQGLLGGGMARLTPGAIVFDPTDSKWGHVAIYAGLGANGKPVYLTTTGWGTTNGKIHLWSLDQINSSGGGFHPKAWLDLTAG